MVDSAPARGQPPIGGGATAIPGLGPAANPRLATGLASPAVASADIVLFRAAEGHPIVKDLLKRFQADVVRREPIAHADWLRRLAGGAAGEGGGDGG